MSVAPHSAYLDYVLEQLAGVPRVTWRRMFGGVGIYSGGLFFALIANDLLYLKVGDANRAEFVSRGMGPFRPFPEKSQYSMSYYEVPADVLEDADELALWAHRSLEIARQPKPRPARRPAGIRKR